jgi:hypothetical protein
MTINIGNMKPEINESLMLAAENYMKSKGYSLTDVISLVLDDTFHSIAVNEEIPKNYFIEDCCPLSAEELDKIFDQTMADYKAGRIKGYHSAEEMHRDLDAEDDEDV